MYSLNSSLIKSYDYNSDSKVLKISFVDNAEVAYDFEGVPEPLVQEFRVFEVVSPRPKLLSDSIKSSIAVDAMFKIFKAPLTRCLFFYLKVWYEIVTVRNTKSEKVL